MRCPSNIGRLSERLKNEPGFREGLKRRVGTEARVSIIIRDFIGNPARAKGLEHRQQMVAWAVPSYNLWVLARQEQFSLPKKIEEELLEAA